MATFTWTPDFQSGKDAKPDVKKIKFGDGYEQRSSFGMNTNLKTYPVTFNNRDISEIDAIDAFLEARGAIESFEWTPPRESAPKMFVCREWSRKFLNAAVDSLTAKFEEVAEP